ncbi:PEGA domain-containing protein [Fibrobacter sp.]|uniref:PEGA domain-containing protein n=1 Tax=Fibrobacter sp. TaxID=35828 RepID=UPI0025BA8C47|nr:PEGA domain-containing protein [Fibrobacter sp.]MBR3071235.1 PEGA domain-containing protein [Fibrobacter sp.]
MKRFAYLLFTVFLLSGISFAKFVAVLETMSDGNDQLSLTERQFLTNMLREQAVRELPAELNFTIMTRENIMMMLPPGKAIEDCEGSCLAETGKNIAADYVAQARVGKVGDNLSISAEIYETAGSKLLASFNGLGADVNALMNVIQEKGPEFFRKARGGTTGIVRTGMDGLENQSFVLQVSTNPQGAALSVDGRPVPSCTSTPCQILVEAGEHRIVAVLEHHEDAEGVFKVNQNGQTVSLDLVPRYGTVQLDLDFPLGGTYDELEIKVDGKLVKGSDKVLMDPGTHAVSIGHRCYSPISFQVGMVKDKIETFKESFKPLNTGLSLTAHSASGESRTYNLLSNGTIVGKTPFSGSIPLCAKLSVESMNGNEVYPVDVELVQGQVVSFDFVEPAPNAENIAVDKLNTDGSQIGESIPANVEQPKSGVRMGLRITSGVVSALGFGAALYGIIKMKNLANEAPDNKKDYEARLDDIDNHEWFRRFGLLFGGIGLVGFGLTFVF